MTPKRLIFRTAVRFCEWMMRVRGLSGCYSSNLPVRRNAKEQRKGLYIVTVAFNNLHVIANQIELIKKNIADNDYHYIVADNSPSPLQRDKIRKLCETSGVGYISLPKNHLRRFFGGSYSHGASLNWIYRKLIRPMNPEAFGFIDHDIFPIVPISISGKLSSQPVYGPLRERSGGRCWYIWAGLGFFRFDFVSDRKVDFMPIRPYDEYMDTGGGNWKDIYSHMNRDEIHFASERHKNFREGGSLLGDMMDIIDESWIHTYNGSHWSDEERDGKDELLDGLLKQLAANGETARRLLE